MKKAIVIGAGIGGLATAVRLKSKGYQVDLFEANNYPGGKLTEIRNSGYRFDAGPSLFTMPELVEDLFKVSGKNIADYFAYKQLDDICKYFYEDGTVLTAESDPEKFAAKASEATGVEKQRVLNHLNKSKFIYDSTADLFLGKSLHKLETFLSIDTLKSVLKLPFLKIGTTMHIFNNSSLKNSKMTQLFNRYATYNGSNPYKAPGILNIIPHLEFNKGAFFPNGGMHKITESIYKLAKDIGVNFHFNSKVERIIVNDNKAVGIKTNKKEFLGDDIICNMDVVPAYRYLMPNEKQPERILKQERSSSALIFYWGITKKFDDLILHNIFFSDNYQKEFEYIFEKKELYDDPTVYINITAKENHKDAPSGKENWFVMINVPHNDEQDWDELIERARNKIITKLDRMLSTSIRDLIEFEDVLNPVMIEEKTSSYKGSLYGTASNSRFAAFFRHPNFSKEIDNLYFCGGSVHPGGGIPLALSSAKIVSELID